MSAATLSITLTDPNARGVPPVWAQEKRKRVKDPMTPAVAVTQIAGAGGRFQHPVCAGNVGGPSRDMRVNVRRRKLLQVLLLFGGALLVISLILLNNTIRLAIFSKRYLINTMKLVGATKWFIMRPFLGSSITQGILSGIIASALFLTAVYGLNEAVPELMSLAETMKIGIIVGGMVGFVYMAFFQAVFQLASGGR